MAIVKPEFYPEALMRWYHRVPGTKNARDLSLKARRYLSAMGWVFWYALKNGKRELRYKSPNGKVYYSLKTACKGYIDEGSGGEGIRVVAQDWEPKQSRKKKSLSQENQPLGELAQPHPPKRGKKLKKQEKARENQINPCLSSSHRQRRSLLSWLMDNNAVSPQAKVYYRNKAGNPLMKGRITREGIQCDCCFMVFALTAFEAHAGSINHRPAANIMLDDGSGRSLSDCQRQVRDSTIQSPETETVSDEVCSVCCYGGELICCDQCPSAFHVNCLGMNEVPDDDWFCPSCCCGICGIGHLSDDGFLTCQQCESKFHVGCQRIKESSNSKNRHTGKSFCSHSCENIFSGLQELTGKPIPVGNSLIWTLLKYTGCSDSDTDIMLVASIEASAETHSKLSVAAY